MDMTTPSWSDAGSSETAARIVRHHSTQIDAAPKYVAEVFGRLAAEHSDAKDDSSAVRGYN
jgi:hypothetical protein